MKPNIPVSFKQVRINNGFWHKRLNINKNVTVYSVMNRFKDTGRFDAFRFDWTPGSDKHKPHYFWDSDVAKWIESVGYILEDTDDKQLREQTDELITLIVNNACDDGYFNIYHTIVEPEKKFRIRDNHELYCLGHLIEAAIAYGDATGDRRLYEVVDRYIDLVIKVFCTEMSAGFITPGHEEIELALFKLYRKSFDEKYLKLAMFFIDSRGVNDENNPEWCNSSYNQSHLPVRQQREAYGHCVRACYLYSAMADAAAITGDNELLVACKALFDDIVNKKMYISGGIGSSHHGEAFTIPYDLPNDSAYAETCASVAMLMFADRMKDIEPDSRYADIVERQMYNGILAGISLDGKSFFYENPLEVNLSEFDRHTSLNDVHDRFPITQRREVFDCSCCPPNLTRFFASVGDHIFSYTEDSIFIHQYVACNAEISEARILLETDYPRDGKVSINVKNANGKKLYLRVPGWCRSFYASTEYETNRGYMKINVDSDDYSLNVEFEMKVEFYAATGKVRADSGKVAVMYGPVLYCLESVDNDFLPWEVSIDCNCLPSLSYSEEFDAHIIILDGFSTAAQSSLYNTIDSIRRNKVTVRLIPYFAHANRGECDMAVWLRRI